jgi:hypothetical protein
VEARPNLGGASMSVVEKARPGRRPDLALRAAWQDRLVRHQQSGLSAAEFCTREGLSLSAFHSWRRKLRPRTPAEPPPLVGLRLLGPAPSVELLLPTGALLRLPVGCDLDLVRSLLMLLKEDATC